MALVCAAFAACALMGGLAKGEGDEPASEKPSTGEVRLELRDGQIIAGIVFDTNGALLDVRRPLGGVQVAKSEVLRWTLDEDENSERPSSMIILKSGHQVSGKIEFSSERGEWVVTLRSGAARYPPEQVLRVVQSSGRCNDGAFTPRPGFGKAIARAIADVNGGTPALRNEAIADLTTFGFFAVPALEQAIKDGNDPDGTFRRLLAQERLAVTLPTEIEQKNPEFLKTIVSGATADRLHLLRQALLEHGSEMFRFFGQLLLDSTQDPEVRAYAIEVLQRMHRVADLLRAFEAAEGQTQLALAVALGDIGIYIGLPTLIEALKLDSREARQLAARKLEEYTGENFGYQVEGPVLEQQTAIARWQGWYREQRARIEEGVAYALRPEDENPHRVKAATLWREGQAAWEARDIVLAETLFRKSIEQDPTALGAYVSLGILAYREKTEYGAAKELFARALARVDGERDSALARLAYYHLGKIYEHGLEFESARQSFRKAVEIDASFADAWYDLGEVTYQIALHLQNVPVEQRRAQFTDAAKCFEAGHDAVVSYRRGLVLLERDALPILPGTTVSRRERNISLRDLRQRMSAIEARFAHRAAQIRLVLGENEKALEWAEVSVKTAEPRADYYLMRAQALAALGRKEEAAADRAKAKELDPEHAVFKDTR